MGIWSRLFGRKARGRCSETVERGAAKQLDKARSELAAILQQDGRVGHPVAQGILHREFQTLQANLTAAARALHARAEGKPGGPGAYEVAAGLKRLCDATLNDPKWALQKVVGTDRCRDRVAKVLRAVEETAEQLQHDTHGDSPGSTEGEPRDEPDALPLALEKGNLRAVKHYLDGGGDPNAAVNGVSFPLHKAIRHGHSDIATLLIRRGADVNGRDKWGCTPLHYAVVSQGPGGRCLPDVAELLLEEGADVNARSKDGWSALMSALDNYQHEMAALLRRHGAQE